MIDFTGNASIGLATLGAVCSFAFWIGRKIEHILRKLKVIDEHCRRLARIESHLKLKPMVFDEEE